MHEARPGTVATTPLQPPSRAVYGARMRAVLRPESDGPRVQPPLGLGLGPDDTGPRCPLDWPPVNPHRRDT